jgi:hypothetical protein
MRIFGLYTDSGTPTSHLRGAFREKYSHFTPADQLDQYPILLPPNGYISSGLSPMHVLELRHALSNGVAYQISCIFQVEFLHHVCPMSSHCFLRNVKGASDLFVGLPFGNQHKQLHVPGETNHHSSRPKWANLLAPQRFQPQPVR